MEYSAALKDKSTQKEGRILDLEAFLNGQTTIMLLAELAASAAAFTTATSTDATEMAAMRDMIQILAASVTALSTKTLSNGGGGGGGKGLNRGGGGGGDGTTQTTGTHKCYDCKKWVKHRDANCFELKANAAKRFPGWVRRLTKK